MAHVEEKLPSRKVLFQHTDVDTVLSVAAAVVFVSWFVAAIVSLIIPTSYAGLVIFLATPMLFILTVVVFLIVFLSMNR